MRENESDSEDGAEQPPEYVSPWAPRDQDEATARSVSEESITPPWETNAPDTIAFGTPPVTGGRYGRGPDAPPTAGNQPGFGQAGYGTPPQDTNQPARSRSGWWKRSAYESQPGPGLGESGLGESGLGESGLGESAGDGQSWYGSQTGAGSQAGPAGYGNPGEPGQAGGGQGWYEGQPGDGSQAGPAGYGGPGQSGPGGYGDPAGQGGPGGFGGAGWAGAGGSTPERPRRGRFLIYVAVAALAASIGAGVTVALADQNSSSSPTISSHDVPGPGNIASGSGASAAPLNEATVEKRVKPGLVDIDSTLRYNSETAEGTGMILSSTGLVLTNNHVINGATSVTASLVSDPGKRYKVRVVGYDDSADVALLQLVGASELTTVNFGNSSQVNLGTTVLALGNAQGRGGVTPSKGIINALNRSIQASDEGSGTTENLTHMLQTSAQIQPGDSGGALADNAGQVIGMITAANPGSGTSSQSGSSGSSLGYAIPINTALTLARQIAGGQSSSNIYIGLPGFLGVQVPQSSSANPQQQAGDEQQSGNSGPLPTGNGPSCLASNEQLTIPDKIAPAHTGALILGVLCGTVAQAKGLVAGDVIISVNGHPVTTPGSLTGITAEYHPGTVVSVTWETVNGARHTAKMTLGAGPAR